MMIVHQNRISSLDVAQHAAKYVEFHYVRIRLIKKKTFWYTVAHWQWTFPDCEGTEFFNGFRWAILKLYLQYFIGGVVM